MRVVLNVTSKDRLINETSPMREKRRADIENVEKFLKIVGNTID